MRVDRELFAAAMDVVDRALDLPPSEREELLARECADPEVRAAARRLLEADAREGDILSQPAAKNAISALASIGAPLAGREGAGSVLGPFSLLSLLGKGGMGEVWVAERVNADFEQKVAVKILPATDDAWIALRFRRERQILARLSHPRIAKLLDGGVTPEGRPWLAMELVVGSSLTEHVVLHDLDVEARLRLFAETCDGVQFAHNHLVVHRDLKPSNIMVTGDGEPKLLDFGIAKSLEVEDASLTQTNERPMTLDYAAPEQILGGEITTATDVWALGVILYELLTGARPHRTTGRGRNELENAILSALPTRPSSSLSTPAAARRPRGSLSALRRTLRGDLDAIVLKAMRKDPLDRYPSAQALGADVRRYLERAPVFARGDATSYLVRAMVRRHWVAFAVSAVVVTSLLVGLVGTLWQARRAREEARKAEVAQSFLISMLRAFDPQEGGGKAVTQSEILERGEARVADLGDQPEVQARLLGVFSETWYGQKDFVHARPPAERALAIERGIYGPRSIEVARTLGLLGNIAYQSGDFAESSRVFDEALAIAREAEGPSGLTVAAALNDLAGARRRLVDFAAAERLRRAALDIYTRRLGEKNPTTIEVMNDLAVLLGDEARFDDGAALQRRACALLAEVQGKDHPDTLICETNLARDLVELGRAPEAEALLTDIQSRQSRVLGEDWFDIANTEQWRGYALDRMGRYEEARGVFEDALARQTKRLGADHPEVARTLAREGTTLRHLGRLDEAEQLARRSLSVCLARLGEDHACTGRARLSLGATLLDEGHPREAEEEVRCALGIFERSFGPNHSETASARAELARVTAKK